jgi:hypothetical protein
MEGVKNKQDNKRPHGFGHLGLQELRPARAAILKKACGEAAQQVGVKTRQLEIAMKLEEIASRRVLHQPQALPERRLLLRDHLPARWAFP